MKKIKLKFAGFSGFGDGWSEKNNWIWDILTSRYDVEISDDPHWLICSIFDNYEYTQYDCPRIFYTGDSFIPDFNLVDYAISWARIELGDRHFRYPACIRNQRFEYTAKELAQRVITPNDVKTILDSKSIFCNFIQSNAGENQLRTIFFEELSAKYKQVTSAGTYLNNMPDGQVIPHSPAKIAFQEKCKFTMAFEPVREPGFCTEKITDAFYAKSIPIYYGDPHITEIFNPKAFINVSDYKNNDEVIEAIRRLDNDDEAYMQMLCEPVFNDPQLPERWYNELCEFFYHIFDQEPSKAYRRSRVYAPAEHNEKLKSLHVVKSHKWGNRLFNATHASIMGGFRGLWRYAFKNRR